MTVQWSGLKFGLTDPPFGPKHERQAQRRPSAAGCKQMNGTEKPNPYLFTVPRGTEQTVFRHQHCSAWKSCASRAMGGSARFGQADHTEEQCTKTTQYGARSSAALPEGMSNG